MPKMTLREARKKRGLLQQEAADLLGCTAASLCRWEQGEREPRVTTFFRMCELYKCRPQDIIFTREVKNNITD